ITPAQERPESVGIIGAGPGGLAAADVLRRAGVQVTIYDRYDRAGGLLTYGIPGFKLEKDVVMRRNEQLEAGGVNFVLNCDVDADIFASIHAEHDAVIIATGVYKSRELSMPNAEADGVVKAIDFLTASNRKSFGDEVPAFDSGALNAEGKRVVVIGGGDTAMDCVRTSIRQGATSVKCLYRRDRANMPGSQREVQNAEEEGVIFDWLRAPKGFTTDGDRVAGVMVQQMRLGQPDATGRQAPELIEGADYVEEADLVIKALGFEPEELPTLWGQPALEVTRWGTVKAAFTTGKTAMDGVYAVGDIVRGASLVVWAIRDGRDCAEAILEQFSTAAIAAE
ncbi:MAG: FAD-dependent oxidoreductase, partial [Pseudomonadota bacterium]